MTVEDGAAPRRAMRRILVAGDNLDALEGHAQLPAKARQEPSRQRTDGGAAAALRLKPRWVMLDIGMPGLDGL